MGEQVSPGAADPAAAAQQFQPEQELEGREQQLWVHPVCLPFPLPSQFLPHLWQLPGEEAWTMTAPAHPSAREQLKQ